MPYKDLRGKTEWKRLHRPQRLARRRELRRIEAARIEAQPEVVRVPDQGPALLLPVLAGGALAASLWLCEPAPREGPQIRRSAYLC